MSMALPLIQNYRPEAPLLWRDAGVIQTDLLSPGRGHSKMDPGTRAPRIALALSASQFLAAVEKLAERLPSASCAINLCENRAHFMLAFAALCVRGQANLLPPSRAPGAVQAIARAYPGSYLICDGEFPDIGVPQFLLRTEDLEAEPSNRQILTPPQILAAATAAIAFTSGSTGVPQPHPKSWRNLVLTAQLCSKRFLGENGHANIVATVPPQHMFGLELSVMLALAGGCSTHAARPLFPADVCAALHSVPEPRVLVTTPVHLKSLAASGLEFPRLERAVSATAPLSRELAQLAEEKLGAPVFEIYGCTEAGSMCTRRTIESERWQPYPGLHMQHRDGVTQVTGPHLDQPAVTPDVVEAHSDGSITLLGRVSDMVKVAGKRGSLAELTGQLLNLPGVQDGVMFMPGGGENARLAALVVAPALSEAGILDALARQIDPAFLPRPLRIVASLPRNELGKLPQSELVALLALPERAERPERQMLEHRTQMKIPSDHPCLAGHFPGKPVVPAVVLLDCVAQALSAALGRTAALRAIPAAKFLSPLAPGEEFCIELQIEPERARARFRCAAGARELVQGRLEYGLDGAP